MRTPVKSFILIYAFFSAFENGTLCGNASIGKKVYEKGRKKKRNLYRPASKQLVAFAANVKASLVSWPPRGHLLEQPFWPFCA